MKRGLLIGWITLLAGCHVVFVFQLGVKEGLALILYAATFGGLLAAGCAVVLILISFSPLGLWEEGWPSKELLWERLVGSFRIGFAGFLIGLHVTCCLGAVLSVAARQDAEYRKSPAPKVNKDVRNGEQSAAADSPRE
jgi:hypothetical protein